MKLYESIPHPLMMVNDLLNHVKYENIEYRINDVFITETALPHNPRQVMSKIGQKRKVNLVMTGTIMNHVSISERILDTSIKDPHKQYDLYGETANFRFFNVRINRNPTAELYIDNNTIFYHYFRVMCVNQGLLDIDDYRNISLTYDELRDICRGTTETLAQYRIRGGYEWRFKYKGDDDDGD
jgi:hypothetical protein